LRRLLALAFLGFASAPAAFAQLEPPSTGGIVALDQELRFLGHYKRVLMIGAHPDDEDTELLTVLVRGMGAEAAYLSLNRGEGGQNLIGPELGDALGLPVDWMEPGNTSPGRMTSGTPRACRRPGNTGPRTQS
jgi:hypothetical protein